MIYHRATLPLGADEITGQLTAVLGAMAAAFESQCNDNKTYVGLSFEDRFGMLVDKEWDKRKSTKLQKVIHDASFRYPNACVEGIEYHADRNIDKAQMIELSTCRYISDNHHIILKGASGNGKTYIACALGIAACKNYIKVRYVRLPDLLNELAVAYGEGTFEKPLRPIGRSIFDLFIYMILLKIWVFVSNLLNKVLFRFL